MTRLQYALKTNDVERVRFLRAHAFWAEPYDLAGIANFLDTHQEMLPIIRESGFDFLDDESMQYLVRGGRKVMRFVLENSPPGSRFSPKAGVFALETQLPSQDMAELMDYLLQNGADPNYVWSDDGEDYAQSLLVLGLTQGASLDVCRVIVRAGALVDPNIPSQNVPLIYAVSRGLPFVKLLVEAGADLEGSQSGYGGESTALIASIELRDFDIIEYLLAIGANPNNQGVSRMALIPLAIAVRYSNNLQIVRMLVEAGAEIPDFVLMLVKMSSDDARNRARWHGVCMRDEMGYNAIMRFLIDCGARD
jgi:hypothetical protein